MRSRAGAGSPTGRSRRAPTRSCRRGSAAPYERHRDCTTDRQPRDGWQLRCRHGSDSPVPRWSNMISRLNEASLRRKAVEARFHPLRLDRVPELGALDVVDVAVTIDLVSDVLLTTQCTSGFGKVHRAGAMRAASKSGRRHEPVSNVRRCKPWLRFRQVRAGETAFVAPSPPQSVSKGLG